MAGEEVRNLGQLFHSIEEAADAPEQFPLVIQHIADEIGAAGGCITADWKAENSTRVLAAARLDGSGVRQYHEYYHRFDVLTAAVRTLSGAGKSWLSQVIAPNLEKTEFYQDFLRRENLFHNAGALISRFQGESQYLSFFRDRTKPAFDTKATALLEMLAPAVGRSLQTQQRVAFRSPDTAVLVLSPNGKLVFANGPAQTLLNNRESLREGPEGQIELKVPGLAGSGTWCPACRKLDASRTDVAFRLFTPGSVLICTLTRLSRTAQLRIEISPVEPASLNIERARQVFGLTKMEAEIARRLGLGQAQPRMAAELGVSVNTVRTHLRGCLTKLGVRRQAEAAIVLAHFSRLF